MFDVKCTECGKSATLPFKPTKGKPVYCRTYYSKHRSNQQRQSNVNTRFDMNNPWVIRGDNWQGRKKVKKWF
jgi:CxxC-x17-CxxC domain-containing protein